MPMVSLTSDQGSAQPDAKSKAEGVSTKRRPSKAGGQDSAQLDVNSISLPRFDLHEAIAPCKIAGTAPENDPTETVVIICNKFHDSVETDAIGLNVIWWVEGDRVTRKGMHREAYMVLKIR